VSAVADFFGEFGQAFSHLVLWAYLAGILAALAQSVVRSRAWRNLLVATFPGSSVRWRDAYGAILAMHGAGIFLPMHSEETVRVGLMKDRIDGASTPAVAATAGVDALFDVLLTVVLVIVSAWLGASVVNWHQIAAHPVKPILFAVLVLTAIVMASIALRRKARGLGHEVAQGLVIFKHRGVYTRTVLGWQLADFALQLATLYLMLVAFGFATVTLVSVVLIRTAQRVTVSMPGFLETGSQQAMIVAILSAGGFPAGQALGFGFGSKVTLSGLTIMLGLGAARVMVGPLHVRTRIGEDLVGLRKKARRLSRRQQRPLPSQRSM
jgi:lysylphosphatidylglycerol synthase-like protein